MVNLKNYLVNFFKLHFIYSWKYSKNGEFKSIVPKKILESKGTKIDPGVRFHNWRVLEKFGNYNFIGKNAFFDNCSEIGNFCSISMDVKIGLRNHNLITIGTSPYFYDKARGMVTNDNSPNHSPVIIGNDVLISANAVILEGVRLGNGAVVAAGAIVNKDVPAYAIVGGVPAKIIKFRFSPNQIKSLEQIDWNRSDIFDFFKENLSKNNFLDITT